MRTTTIITGIICILLGIGLVAGALHDNKHWYTAGIPIYVGIVWIVLGYFAQSRRSRMILMHIAALLAVVLAAGGIAMGLPKLIKYHNGTLPPDAAVRPLAWWGQVTLAIIMIAYMVLAIRSFVQARRWRKAHNGEPMP